MNIEFVQAIIEIVFKGHMLYLAPFIFLLMVLLFTEQLIGLIRSSFGGNGGRRSSR